MKLYFLLSYFLTTPVTFSVTGKEGVPFEAFEFTFFKQCLQFLENLLVPFNSYIVLHSKKLFKVLTKSVLFS